MNTLKGISISVTNNFYLNLLNFAVFVIIAITGSLIQIEYHMHRLPEGYPIIGLDKSGWLLLHKVSAIMFLAGIGGHCSLNWRFVSVSTRRIFHRKLIPSAPLSYWLFLICVPTFLTAMTSWILLGPKDQPRFLLIETHDKLGWLLIIFTTIHIVSRARRMTRAYRELIRGTD